MNSLLVLRDQVNVLAPNRSKGADGLVGDDAHQGTNSDHNPHYVPGVGAEIVTALDLTHDPDHGFDSYAFAETLRRNRDPRIKYVISNHRIFSSYASGGRAAWEWGSYNGVDPHTNHVHISVLDATISDTTTRWDLGGFALTQADVIVAESALWDKAANRSDPTGRNFANDVYAVMSAGLADEFSSTAAQITALGQSMAAGFAQVAGVLSEMQSALAALRIQLQEIENKIDDLESGSGTPGGPVSYNLNISGSFTGSAVPVPEP
jgi:hypothetical protein